MPPNLSKLKPLMVKLFATLIGIGGLCGILLVGTHSLTQQQITDNRQAQAKRLMADMLGHSLPADLDTAAHFIGNCKHWVFSSVEVPGYAGVIHLLALVRFNINENQLTLRVIQHSETPNIGDFVDHTKDPWITQLDNSPVNTFVSVDNVSGATVTTQAIKQAAQLSAERIGAHCDKPD